MNTHDRSFRQPRFCVVGGKKEGFGGSGPPPEKNLSNRDELVRNVNNSHHPRVSKAEADAVIPETNVTQHK